MYGAMLLGSYIILEVEYYLKIEYDRLKMYILSPKPTIKNQKQREIDN